MSAEMTQIMGEFIGTLILVLLGDVSVQLLT